MKILKEKKNSIFTWILQLMYEDNENLIRNMFSIVHLQHFELYDQKHDSTWNFIFQKKKKQKKKNSIYSLEQTK